LVDLTPLSIPTRALRPGEEKRLETVESVGSDPAAGNARLIYAEEHYDRAAQDNASP
jgi:hypothetical protein